jgi:hypothetical protein
VSTLPYAPAFLGFKRQEIKVSLEPRLSISGKAELHEDHHSGKYTHSLKHEQLMFRVIDLPCEVNLSKTKATFNDGTLEIVMPTTAPAKSIRVETTPGLPAEDNASGLEAAVAGGPGINEPIFRGQAASARR